MRFIYLVICCAFLLSFPLSHHVAAAPTTQYVQEDTLLTEAATTDAKVIATIKKYSSVTVLSSSAGWSHVQYEKQQGYIETARLSSKKPTTKTMYIHAKNDIYLRDKPSASAKKSATIPNRAAVFVYYSADGWSYIHYNKQKGFVYTSALTSKKPTTTVTGGLMPKVGLKLTYSNGFLSSGTTTYTMKKDMVINNKVLSVAYSNNGYEEAYFLEDGAGISFAFKDSYQIIFNLYWPLKEGKTALYIGPHDYETLNLLIESTTATVTVKAGTFNNVVIFTSLEGIRYYLAKGLGVIKMEYADGTVNELVKVE